MVLNYRICFLIFLPLNIVLYSQQTGSVNNYISIMGHYGKTEIHSKYVNNLTGSHPKGLEFEIGQHHLTPKALNTFGCFPRYGVAVNYWNYDYSEVGWGLTSSVFFEPFLLMHEKFMWSIRGGAGLGWLSNPYSETNNPDNLAYSTHFNFPLHIGMSVYKPISRKVSLKLSASFRHISNGAVKYPNYGINYSVLSFGIDHSLSGYYFPKKTYSDGLKLSKEQRSKRMEAVLGGGGKDVSGEHYMMSFFQGRYVNQWTRINGWTAGFLGEYALYEQNDFFEKSRVSIFAGHEFFFSKVGFTQEFGWYLYHPYSGGKTFFQLYSLHLKISQWLRVGVSLKAHANVAEYVAGRVAYVFIL